MKTKEEILDTNRTKYNKSLTSEETLAILKRNHNEWIISPDDCYKAMEEYGKQCYNQALMDVVNIPYSARQGSEILKLEKK